jgi:hypothetical protein
MLKRLRSHLPLVATALIVGVVASGGPVAARAAYDAMNAHKVDGFHAVGFGASTSSRSGKLVATNRTGRLPNNIIRMAPNTQKFNNLTASAFASKILYNFGTFAVTDASYCPTAAFTPTRPSYALVQVDTDVTGGTGGGSFALAAGFSVNGGAFGQATPQWNTGTSAAQDLFASVSNTGVVALSAGSTYRFAGVGSEFSGSVSGSDCKVIAQIMPKLPGTSLTPASKTRAGLRGPSGIN